MAGSFNTAAIRKILAREQFVSEDFAVQTKVDETGLEILEVVFQPDSSFHFKAGVQIEQQEDLRKAPTYRVFVRCRPGSLLTEQHSTFTSLRDFNAELQAWVRRVEENLASRPLARRVEHHAKLIDELVDSVQGAAGEYFTREEAEALRARLDDLEEQLKEALAEDDGPRPAGVLEREITQDVKVLKERVEQLDKPGWARALAIRMTRWMSSSKNVDLITSGIELTKQILQIGPGE